MAGKLLIAFVVVPIIELWLLIEIGRQIGALTTIVIVILTAILGSQLVRRQGISVMQRIQSAQARGEVPALPMVNGAALLMAGLMLLTPGFITDFCGFILLIPKLRERIARYLLSRVVIATPFGFKRPWRSNDDDDIIEGDYERRKDNTRANLRNSHDRRKQ